MPENAIRTLLLNFIQPLAVTQIYNRYKVRYAVLQAPRQGGPRKTTSRDDKIIIRVAKENRRLTAVDIDKDMVQFHELSVSKETVKRRLCNNELFGCCPCKRPMVSLKSRKARMKFTRAHLSWSTEDWKKVIFSDESNFCLF